MAKKYKIDGSIYTEDQLSASALDAAQKIEFLDKRLVECEASWLVMKYAKNNYIKDLKTEILSDKAGLVSK